MQRGRWFVENECGNCKRRIKSKQIYVQLKRKECEYKAGQLHVEETAYLFRI